jgi:hypothetical protein
LIGQPTYFRSSLKMSFYVGVVNSDGAVLLKLFK